MKCPRKKLCPLLMIKNGLQEQSECLQSGCAWWTTEYIHSTAYEDSGCAMEKIAANLRSMAD